MKLSVVTISFNQENFIKQCIESVLNQSHPDIEYIVVDPGSTDSSREIIKSYGSKIIAIFENDQGPADGLNKGFARATGELFYFVNSDDIMAEGAAAEAVRIVEKLKCDILLGGGYIIDRYGNLVKRVFPSKFTKNLYLHGAVTFLQQGCFFKKRIFQDIGGFNINNRVSWDGELMFDFMGMNPRVAYCFSVFGFFRIYDESITGSGLFVGKSQEVVGRLFEKEYGRKQSTLDIYLNRFYKKLKYLLSPRYALMNFLAKVGRATSRAK